VFVQVRAVDALHAAVTWGGPWKLRRLDEGVDLRGARRRAGRCSAVAGL